MRPLPHRLLKAASAARYRRAFLAAIPYRPSELNEGTPATGEPLFFDRARRLPADPGDFFSREQGFWVGRNRPTCRLIRLQYLFTHGVISSRGGSATIRGKRRAKLK